MHIIYLLLIQISCALPGRIMKHIIVCPILYNEFILIFHSKWYEKNHIVRHISLKSLLKMKTHM